MPAKSPPLLLGSASPRRRRLLGTLGVKFEVVAPDVREVHRTDRPRWTAAENARRKHLWCRAKFPNHRILAADTVVAFRGRCIGKPANRVEAAAFLRLFSGNTHAVHTAVAYSTPRGALKHIVVTSRVTFRVLTAADIREYLKRVNPLDKAGAYDIAQHGTRLITECKGSRSNVSGLPVETVSAWLGIRET